MDYRQNGATAGGGDGLSLPSSPSSCFGGCAADGGFLNEFRRHLAGVDALASFHLRVALGEVEKHALASSRTAAEGALVHALALAELRRILAGIHDFTVRPRGAPVYIMSSFFLTESYAYLVKDPAEDMHYVTGCEFGPVRVLERLIEFDKTERTPIGVAGDPASSHKALIAIGAKGHRLLAWMHSHPGKGEWATRPSPTDLDHQRRLEKGGYPAVGAIFSRDGYVRFFPGESPFRVEVFGEGVRRVDERVYQLDD